MTLSFGEWFPGVAAMPNVHPLLVHFPIALYYAFLLASGLALIARSDSLRRAGSWMLYFGTAGAAAAVVAGLSAADSVEHDEAVHAIMELHETYGFVVLALGVLLSAVHGFLRSSRSVAGRLAEWVLALTLVAAITRGADLGGLLVYGHGVAVNAPCQCDAITELRSEPPPVPATAPSPAADTAPPADPAPHRHTHPHSGKHRHKN